VIVLQLIAEPLTAGPLLPLWIVSQRPRQHFLIRCPAEYADAVIAQAKSLAAPPVRLWECTDLCRLPSDKTGTLLLNDVSALGLAEQIALYDWLGSGADAVRVIAITTAPLALLVARGVFLEALCHRLGAVQFDLARGECASWK
jgi:hypothetical protein